MDPGSESWRPGGWAFAQPARIDKAFFDRIGGVSKAEGQGEDMEGHTGQPVSQSAPGFLPLSSQTPKTITGSRGHTHDGRAARQQHPHFTTNDGRHVQFFQRASGVQP